MRYVITTVPGTLQSLPSCVFECALSGLFTCMYTVVCLQLVFEAEPLAAAVALVRLLSCVDAFMAPQRAVISEAAPTEFTLERVIA